MKNLIHILVWLFAFTSVPGFPASSKEPFLHEKPSQAPEKIEVRETPSDAAISTRLNAILNTTGWFAEPRVKVEDGVVFLYGQTKNIQFKDWAGDLAHNTQGVAAVVNKIVVLEPSVWDVHLILQELLSQARKLVRAIPNIIFGTLILLVSWILARFVHKLVLYVFRDKMNPPLLHEVFARAVSFLVFLLGVYFIFEMAELTAVALTVMSGTGLLGIILGIAFRDITENFLASILLSMQNPFHPGDFIDIICPVTGYTASGYVERLTFRVTILLTPEGNSMQIANSTVYKSNIRNYTSNPTRRDDFTVNISYNASLSKAQNAIRKVLEEHEAVLKNPEPLVLVDQFMKDLINLRVYYWIDAKKYSWLKVRSSIMRLVKKVFQTEGIELPMPLGKPISLSPEPAHPHSLSDSPLTNQDEEIKDSSLSSPKSGTNLLSNRTQDEG